jgi:hypothetical protein
MNVCLIACAKTKLNHATEAKSLYASPLFQKSRAYAEKYFDAWGILSAKHGLVLPNQIIGPYDVTLKSMNRVERKRWCDLTYAEIVARWGIDAEYTVLAGAPYLCAVAGLKIEEPLRGLQVGERLQWLNEALK